MDSDLSPDELSDTCTPARPATHNWRPVLGPLLEGKLCLALAVGLSQREAENWVDQGEEIIGRLLAVDEGFAREVKEYEVLGRLQPLLRVHMNIQKSWAASAWLAEFLRSRAGRASVDELQAEFPRLFQMLRGTIYSDEARAAEFDEHYPIGDR